MNYAYWTEYLKSARNKTDRPINGSSTKRVIRGLNGDIILRLHWTDVVTLHADGTETINTGGWHTVSTMRFIAEHSRARVWSHNWQLYVRTNNPTFTPPRVTKCRRCKAGQCKQECYGPGWCYSAREGYSYEWGSRPDELCEHGETRHHRLPRCHHGETAAHALPSVDCWQCKGEGRYDYGSNAVHYKWDGAPLTIDCNGYPVGPVPSKNGYPVGPVPSKYDTPLPAVAVSTGSSYGDSGELLKSALPALATVVQCPHCPMKIGAIDSIVIHLNDTARWSRESVADWLDTLDVDLSFPVPDFIPAHITA
jgi:hypothetical protein